MYPSVSLSTNSGKIPNFSLENSGSMPSSDGTIQFPWWIIATLLFVKVLQQMYYNLMTKLVVHYICLVNLCTLSFDLHI